MQLLTERQETILALIVHEYIETAKPISSKKLVSKYNLGISSATVRNEMVALADANVIRQPHTSAGRVPTEEGYRYFVRKLIGDTGLTSHEKRTISHQFHQARAHVDEWVRLGASVLAQHSRVASVVTAPHPERAIFKHLELINTSGNQVLLVLVLQGGDVRQQMLTLAEIIDQEQLSRIANHITDTCNGMYADAIANQAGSYSDLGQDVLKLIVEIMARTEAVSAGEIHRDGLSNVLNQPEFANSDSARQALQFLENRGVFEEVLAKALSPQVGGVQVVIGGEGAWEELKDYSMILARYGAQGYATGALGVLGPIRMSYGRTISAVRDVAGLMSDLVIETFAG
jgi:heat-inducible transcriptional repressor